jgi:flagellar basal body-associated protein FliL
LSENGSEIANPKLAQDDFDWGQNGEGQEGQEGQEEQPQQSTDGTAPKTTELDRIEFYDDEPQEEPQEEVQPVVEEPKVEAPPEETLLTRLMALLRSPKVLVASGVSILGLCVISGIFIYFVASGSVVEETMPAPQTISLPPQELRLGNFIVPTGNKDGASFMTYSVDLTINGSLFEFYRAEEEQVRAEIFSILKAAAGEPVSGKFSDEVKHRVNDKLRHKVIVAANIISADRI